MACKIGLSRADRFERIDSALDALVRFLEKKPTITGLNVLSSRVKNEISLEQKRLRTYMDEKLIRNSDQLEIEHLKREMKNRKSKLIYLEDKLISIMATCRGIFKSQTTRIEQCHSKLTELKHINERPTNYVNEKKAQLSDMKSNIYGIKSREGNTKMTQKTELHHFERKVKKTVSEQRCQQTLNHEQEKNITSVIRHLEKEIACRDLKVKQLEEDLHKTKEIVYCLENKLKDKDSQLLKTCQQLSQLRTTETERNETITSLKRKKLGTAVDIESRDKRTIELENRLDSVGTANELLRKKIKTQEEQLLKRRDEQQRPSNQLYDFKTDQTKTIKSLKTENQEKDNHISKLSYQLKQALNTVDDKNAEIKQINISLKERVRNTEKEGERVRHFEELLNRKMAEIDQMNENIDFLNKNMKKKESQLHELREQLDCNFDRLRETENESGEIKKSLEQKNQNLGTEIKLRNQHVKDLEQKLDSIRIEKDAEKERLEQNLCTKEIAMEKDNQISKLRYQQEHSFKKWQNRETELNENVMALERKNKQYEKKLKGTYFKMTQSSEQQDKLQASQDDLLETIADLKKINLDHEAECGLKVKHNDRMTQLKDENMLLENILEEKDRDQREQSQQAYNKLNEKEIEMKDIIISLKKQQEEEEHLKLDLNDQLKQTLKKLNDKEADMTEIKRKLKGLEAEMDHREQKVKDLEELLDGRKTEVTKLTEINEFLEKKLKEMGDRLREQEEQQRIKTQYLQKEVKDRDRKVSDLEDVLQNKQKQNMVNEEEKDVSGKGEKTSELDEQIEMTLREVHDTEVELDDTKTLSVKAIGDILTEFNPINTDLSDINRPTKLAERCAELYENQWTDSFEILKKYFDTEENVEESLLKILQDAMTFCKTRARTQMEELGRELTFAEQNVQGNGDMLADVRKLFNDCKRIMVPVAVGNLNKRYASRLKRSTDKTLRSALEISSYTSECLEICWLMVIHDPPVVFAPLVRKGSSFNTDLYKPYTTSGTHIDYVVWPPVLLHEGGPILAKGVAQGYSNVQQCSSAMYRK